VIEEFAPVKEISRGKYIGQTSTETWLIVGYYGKLRDMPSRLLELHLSGTFSDVNSLKDEIKRAEKKVITVLAANHAKQPKIYQFDCKNASGVKFYTLGELYSLS